MAYRFSKIDHEITSYLKPLLFKPDRGLITTPQGAIAYPSWMLIPRPENKDAYSEERGTKQGRITAIGPGLQTFPSSIKDAVCSRFPGGRIHAWDYKQIELRVPAMLSLDPVMLEEFAQGVDQHTKTAKTKILNVVGITVEETSKVFRKVWRQAAKRLNFLTLYRGGASAYRAALLRDAVKAGDFDLLKTFDRQMTLEVCQASLTAYDREYHHFRAWQDERIAKAITDGYLELPTGWSRTFAGGAAMVNELLINEICNFDIQGTAAQLVQDAQMEALLFLKENHLRTRICSQTYDSIRFDVPPQEDAIILQHIPPILTNPPLLAIIDKSKGQVPLAIEKE
jgi:DNA polymerase-1